jgi:hypothetical protein
MKIRLSSSVEGSKVNILKIKFLSACKSGELTGVVHLLTTQMECILGVNRGDPYYVLNVPSLPDACDKNNID